MRTDCALIAEYDRGEKIAYNTECEGYISATVAKILSINATSYMPLSVMFIESSQCPRSGVCYTIEACYWVESSLLFVGFISPHPCFYIGHCHVRYNEYHPHV